MALIVCYRQLATTKKLSASTSSLQLLNLRTASSKLLVTVAFIEYGLSSMNSSQTPVNGSSHVTSGSEGLVGFVVEDGGRGTISLLWTCLLTTFLCTWVVIHPRIDKRQKFRVSHKLALSLKTILAPEFIAVEGAQEWTQARKVVKDCRPFTGDQPMTLVQSFYVGMFGIRYRTAAGTRVLWPNQFVWLLQRGLFKWEDHASWGMALQDIRDRSNADGAAKFFALAQVAWFVAQAIIRAVNDLPFAPFESMTLGYIPLFGLTYFFWWVKPKDIEHPTEIDLPPMTEDEQTYFESMSISHDFDNEGSPRQTSLWSIWYLTPRTFEKEARDRRLQQREEEIVEHVQRHKDHGFPILVRAKPLNVKEKEDDIVLAHWDPDLYRSKLWPITCLFGISFPALHLVSWNGVFPTVFELWLWRVSGIVSMVSMLVFMQSERLVARRNDPWTIVKVFCPAIYLLTRVIMLAEACASFRGLDPGTYETIVLTKYWFHLA